MSNKNIKEAEALKVLASMQVESVDRVLGFHATATEQEEYLNKVFASLTPESKNTVIDYWKKLRGNEFATDMVKDYLPRGEKTKVEAGTNSNTRTASLTGESKSTVKDYWSKLRGSEFANDMVKNYKTDGEKQDVLASLSESSIRAMASLDNKTLGEIYNLLAAAAKKN